MRRTIGVSPVLASKRILLILTAGALLLLGVWFMTSSAAPPVHPHEAEIKNEDGSWKYTNKLIDQTSPYLLQHAHNPVDWYAWGPEAFAESRKTGKPIFLSVGYSTCYWCHVMERQVFENPEIAAKMNELFVSIKVDREERPDVDDIYMAATQLMNRQGGWPMSVFLTPPGAKGENDPGLKPFWAGTYIPPEPAYGRPGFPQVLDELSRAWNENRQQVLTTADRAADAVKQYLARRDSGGELTDALVQNVTNQLLRNYDRTHGGFGTAPKFPQPNNLLLLCRVYQNNPNDQLWRALSYTLERMARGGMYDQIGGGFHRYSTDEKWLVPHFEKMLYDNAQLVEAYCIAHSIKPHDADTDFYPRVIRAVCDYVLREMTDPTGTFWSAQDAEVDAREGGNYVWTAEQVRQALDDDALADLAVTMYGLDRGTNFQDPHHPDEPPANVLFLPKPLHELADDRGVTVDQLLTTKARIDKTLLAVRDQRKQPATDDKVVVSWNGLMIAGLARAARELNEDRYAAAAARAADYILANMRTSDGGLYRTMRKGQVKIPAFLEDYAFFVHGLIELHRTTGEPRWLEAAEALTNLAQRKFTAENGGYYDTLADQDDLFVRTRSTYDGAISSGNSQMAHNLVDLYELTANVEYLNRVEADLRSFAGAMTDNGAAMAHMHSALLRAIEADPPRFAQAPPPKPDKPRPVTARLEPGTLDMTNGQAKLRLAITMADDYHVNSNNPSVEGLIATTVELADADGLELVVDYPPGKNKRYALADEELSVYDGTVVIEATLRKTSDFDPNLRPRLILRYQACTDTTCLAPETIELPITISQ